MKFLKFLSVIAFFTMMMVSCSKTTEINPSNASDLVATTRGDSSKCDTTHGGGHGGPGHGGPGNGGGPRDTIRPKGDTSRHHGILPLPRDTSKGGKPKHK
jgi:hypothetical protein